MMDPVTERRMPVSPQIAVRVAFLGGLALVLFGIIFFRLWYLQVLSGAQYLQQANTNRIRDEVIPAPRGDVVDRNGRPLISSRPATAVQLQPQELPGDPTARTRVYRRLGRVLRMSPARIAHAYDRKHLQLPYAPVTVKLDAGQAVLDYIKEHQDDFPGVQTNQIYLREYPQHQVGAQLVGTVGEINPAELRQPRFKGIQQGSIVGQSGIEWTYDRYLRGRDGDQRVQVNSLGHLQGQVGTVAPAEGNSLRLSLDLGLQRAGQDALAQGMGLASGNGHGPPGGAFVALDPRNGDVLALGSAPTFDPNVFAKPVPRKVFRQLNDQPNKPLYDRAIAGLYPTGSTFKPITAMAALQSGLITPDTPIASPGCITIGAQQFCSAGKADYGTVSLREAIKVSSDVFFYRLGEYANPVASHPIQTWARRLGLGHGTGIDLPGEFGGLIPDPAWRARVDEKERQCERRRHVSTCGISDKRPWSVGDNVNLAVGQGDVEATPLQMAVAYSGIVNGGRVVRPHLGLEVDDQAGRLVQRIDPPPARRVHYSQANRQAIMDGLHMATSESGGTSADVFSGFPIPVYGKTGTAQHTNQDDQSWYVCYATDGARPILVAVTIEQGGFGAEAAAPAARLILSQWFHVQKQLVSGHSQTR